MGITYDVDAPKSAAVFVRPATPADDRDVAELIHGSPSPEATGIAGGSDRAAELGRALFRAGIGRTLHDEIYLATVADEPVGVLLGRRQGDNFPVRIRALPFLLRCVLRLYSPFEIPALLSRVRLRSRLEFPIPPESFHVIELHVAPEHRGRSIGTILLRHAEERALQLGCRRMNLTTALSNPARRLYERLGFELLHERRIPEYEATTGTPGRAFFEKSLSPASRPSPAPVLYRDAVVSDVDSLKEFIFEHGANQLNHLPRAEVSARLDAIDRGQTFGVVATDAGQLRGLATFALCRRFASYESLEGREAEHGYIREVVVHRDFAGRGIGTELLECCKQRILARGAQSIYIDRHEENAPSAAIMRKAGFVEVETYSDPERRPTGSRSSTICRYIPEGTA